MKIEINEEEFVSLPSEKRDWMIFRTFHAQVPLCERKFLTKNQAKIVVLAILAVVAGAGSYLKFFMGAF